MKNFPMTIILTKKILKKGVDNLNPLCYYNYRKRKEIKTMKATQYIMNIEYGNIFPATPEGIKEAEAEAKELYDWGDPTNDINFWEYYKIIWA